MQDKSPPIVVVPRPLLRRQDLERWLQLSGRTIYRLVDAGQLPHPVAIGRSVRWRVEEVESYICHNDGK